MEKINWSSVGTEKEISIILQQIIPEEILKLHQIYERIRKQKESIFYKETKADGAEVIKHFNRLKKFLVVAERLFSFLSTWLTTRMSKVQLRVDHAMELICVLIHETSTTREACKQHLECSESIFEEQAGIIKKTLKYPNVQDYKDAVDLQYRAQLFMIFDRYLYLRNHYIHVRKKFLENWKILFEPEKDTSSGLYN